MESINLEFFIVIALWLYKELLPLQKLQKEAYKLSCFHYFRAHVAEQFS